MWLRFYLFHDIQEGFRLYVCVNAAYRIAGKPYRLQAFTNWEDNLVTLGSIISFN